MNIHLADSLEEFDLRYIESCNQCFSSIYSDDINHRNLLDSKSKLTLSSPLLNNGDEYPKFTTSSTRFPIFNDTNQKVKTSNFSFKKPPLKPNFKSDVGNPFYKPTPAFIKSRDESPTKKRKTSYDTLLNVDSTVATDTKHLIRDSDNETYNENSEKYTSSDSEKDSESEKESEDSDILKPNVVEQDSKPSSNSSATTTTVALQVNPDDA